jgi:Protein of unknown function (DUF4058)
MPAHDWTRVNDGIFHDFHVGWIGEVRRALNGGLLPEGYYALAEQIAGGLGPDVLTLREPAAPGNGAAGPVSGAVAVADTPPRVTVTARATQTTYTERQCTLVIRHTSDHRIVALIEVLSPGNKASQHAVRSFVDKALAALSHGIHLLLLDLHPPGPRDPNGVHGLVWGDLTGEAYQAPADKPLTLAAYAAGLVKTAYVQPFAVGEALPEMPLFLTPEDYINVPLEATYSRAYEGVPRFYRNVLEN